MLFIALQVYAALSIQLGSVLAVALKPYDSLAGLSRDEVDAFASGVKVVGAQPVPPPIKDTSLKLVNDALHPWRPLSPGQQRGPCPGLNTLASHGWLPRSGVATPAQIMDAVQNGFNMAFSTALVITYAAFLVDGNPLTNLISIGGSSRLTGPSPPAPAVVGGLSRHGTFEGDASMTRSDAFLGDNHSFNETLFQQLVSISNAVGGGKYNVSAAAEVRFQRFQDSVARNPTFDFSNPRFATAFGETIFPMAFFIDGRDKSLALDLEVMRGFFQDSRMPVDFHRREGAFDGGGTEFDLIFNSHDYFPGFNNGSVNNFVADPFFLGTQTVAACALYEKATQFVNTTVALYPSPSGVLRDALNKNLDNFFLGFADQCTQIRPFP